MTQSIPKPQVMTLDEFMDWYPDGLGCFELHDGVVIEMQPTGTHEQVAAELSTELSIESRRLKFPFLISRQCMIKPIDSDKSGYIPDIAAIDRYALEDEPMWKRRSLITQGKTVRLVIEVVSTNWQDDYLVKLAEYEKLGISEYWIVDYLGLGGRRYIGNPKQPTISVYQMLDGEYTIQQYRQNQRIESLIFPELSLTAEQVFQLGE